MDLTLGDIEKALNKRITYRGANSDTKVSCVDVDSRKIEDGGVFIATVGERVDGHRFIRDVFGKGAVLAIVQKSQKQVCDEHGIQPDIWKSYVMVEDPFEALKSIGEYYRRKLNIPIVGITGSVGKTSTKEYIAGVLAQKYNVLKTDGNYNNEIGVPLTLLRIREEHTAAVIEMGISDFGEMHRLSKMVKPDICVITNIGQCHLENLKTRDGILKAKTEIFDFMNPQGAVCLNGDDDKLSTIKEVNGRKVYFFGLDKDIYSNAEQIWQDGKGQSENKNAGKAVYAIDIINYGLWGSSAKIYVAGEEEPIQAKVTLPGKHMVINATAATCVGKLLGLTNGQIKDGIGSVEAISGRNHLINAIKYTLIDDCYNANPASMRAAIDLLMMADTKKVAILGDMFELGENSDALHASVGEYAVKAGVDILLCVGENAKHMYDAAVAARDASGKSYEQTILYFKDREALLRRIEVDRITVVPDGSTALIKASHGMKFTEVLDMLQ